MAFDIELKSNLAAYGEHFLEMVCRFWPKTFGGLVWSFRFWSIDVQQANSLIDVVDGDDYGVAIDHSDHGS